MMSDGNAGNTGETAISVRGLGKFFGAKKALEDVWLDIPKNAVYGVLGPNGAGKTTLFSIIAGFLRSDTGSVTFPLFGDDLVAGSPAPGAGMITILPQDARFQANIPVLEQLVYLLRLQGFSPSAAVQEVERVLAIVGLDNELFATADTFSHGMYQRLCLAQAFLGDPSIVILDEPTAGLDHRNAHTVRGYIRTLSQQATVLIASHNMAELQELCTHMAVLDFGRTAKAGSVREVTGQEIFLQLVLSRDLEEAELEQLTKGPVSEVTAQGDACYRVGLLDENDSAAVDAKRSAIIRILLDLGVTVREIREDNRIAGAYSRLVDS